MKKNHTFFIQPAISEKEVMVLIDEIDAPFIYCINNKVDPDEMKQIFGFIECFVNAIYKEERGPLHGILAGVTNPGFGSTSGVTYWTLNITKNDTNLLKYFGFNSNDVQKMGKKLNIPYNLIQQAKEWYNGNQIFA